MIKIMKRNIEHIVSEKLNSKIIDLRRIETGLFNDTYFVKANKVVSELKSKPVNTNEFIIRIAPKDDSGFLFYEVNMMDQEPNIHEIVSQKTSIPIPQIYEFDNSRKIIERNYLIMEKMEGIALSQAYFLTQIQRKNIFHQIGQYLQELHNIHASEYGYLGEHRPMEPQKTWWEAFTIMWSKLIDDVFNCGVYSESEAQKYKDLLLSHREYFVARNSVPSSLLHMDIWAQNIMVNEGGMITAIVDWDRALWGDPEIEFTVLDYCGISTPSFWEGYEGQQADNKSSKVRDLYYLLYEHQKYIPINIWRRKNKIKAQSYKRDCVRLFKKLEKIG
ncbi:MAG: phosphotransferase [Candidatus Lokiarchaeota archaeon]|nr:phosphotransferase [Candidatus Lokiarchaeota archaeon]MBD3337502.1 phosphotransferase [Candidatus Lokiarchaeota archaeon]